MPDGISSVFDANQGPLLQGFNIIGLLVANEKKSNPSGALIEVA